MTEAPRSLNEPVGMNHSHFSSAVPLPIAISTMGVQPSPIEIGAFGRKGNALA